MSLQDTLKETLDAAPGIDLVALGDLSSGLILHSTAREVCPREVLDQMSERASAGFGTLATFTVPQGVNAEALGNLVIHFNERQTEVFARHPSAPDDIVCTRSRPGVPLLPVLRAGLGTAYGLFETP